MRRRATAGMLFVGLLLSPSGASAHDARPDIPYVESAVAAVSAHAEWRVVNGNRVTRYAAWGVRIVAPEYYSDVHTDVGVLRRQCTLRADRGGDCNFRPRDGVDSEIDFLWDPTLSQINLTFKYRNHTHSVTWVGRGEHQVSHGAAVSPPLYGISPIVSRSATASGTIYGDAVGRKGLVREETHVWQGGLLLSWVPVVSGELN